MTISKEKHTKAVGYIRVSTDKQASDDGELGRQAERIRRACMKHGFELLPIYEDVGSGADPLGAVRRDGLIDAVAHAREAGAILIVPEPTRLFRNVQAAEDFLQNLVLPVFSVREGRFMKTRALLNAIQRGENSVHNIRQGTRDVLAQKSAGVTSFANPNVRSEAARASAKARALKSDEIVFKIAQILQSDPVHRTLSHKALADHLNQRRLLTGWDRPWTKSSIRTARKKAEEQIAEWDEVERFADEGYSIQGSSSNGASDAKAEPAPVQAEELDDGMAEMHRNPIFGMF